MNLYQLAELDAPHYGPESNLYPLFKEVEAQNRFYRQAAPKLLKGLEGLAERWRCYCVTHRIHDNGCTTCEEAAVRADCANQLLNLLQQLDLADAPGVE